MGHVNRELSRQRTKFDELQAQAQEYGDSNDCTVKALAIAGDIPYATARQMLADRGRQKGKGTNTRNVLSSLRELGKTTRLVRSSHFIDRYPKAHRILQHVTSHHMDRFNNVWADGHTYLCVTNSHVFTVVDGTNHDWTRGRVLRVLQIYRVE